MKSPWGFIGRTPRGLERDGEFHGAGAGAGYDQIYLHNIGPHQEEFFRFFAEEVRPAL